MASNVPVEYPLEFMTAIVSEQSGEVRDGREALIYLKVVVERRSAENRPSVSWHTIALLQTLLSLQARDSNGRAGGI